MPDGLQAVLIGAAIIMGLVVFFALMELFSISKNLKKIVAALPPQPEPETADESPEAKDKARSFMGMK